MRDVPARRLGLAAAVLAAIPFVPSTGFAQNSAVLEEIIVTARKRQESIQEVPIALSAFSGDQLRDAGITNIKQISTQVPGLQIDDQSTAQIWIRGIGQRDDSARVDGPVGVYIDGVYIARKDAQLLDIVDPESVQVLRGPQGTLFGKNTTAGALVINTRKPDENFGGYVEVRGGDYGRRDAKGVINVPLVDDTLYSKLTVSSVKRDGYVDNINTGQEMGSEDRLSGALQLRWLPTDNVSADWFLFYNKTREVQIATNCVWMNESSYNGEDSLFANRTWSGDTTVTWPFESILDAGTASFVEGIPLNEVSQSYKDACDTATDLISKDQVNTDARHAFNLNNMMTGLTIEWEINEDLSFKSITGYGDQKLFGLPNSADNDGAAGLYSGRHLLDGSQREQISQEFQLNGAAMDERLQYTVGIFGMVEDIDDGTTYQFARPSGTYFPTFFGPPVGGLIFVNEPSAQADSYKLKNTTYAAFFQGTYDLTDHLALTLGVRWTSEKRETELDQRRLDQTAFFTALATGGISGYNPLLPGFIDPAFIGDDPFGQIEALFPIGSRGEILYPLGESTRYEADETWEEVSPMGSLSYTVPDQWFDGSFVDSMLTYFTYSEGFKSGTFEPVGADGLATVDPEIVINYEVGFKVDAFDRSLRMNMAIYQMEYEDMQLRQVIADSNGTPAVVLNNASKSEINGVELEVTWTPVAGLVANFGASVNDYDFKDFTDQQFSTGALFTGAPLPVVDRSNEPFPEVPNKTFNFGIQYSWVTDVGTFIPRIDYRYQDEIFLGLDPGAGSNVDQSTVDEAELVNARIAWVAPKENWELALYATNLTDEEYFQGAAAVGDTVGTFPLTKAPPRMWGAEVLYRFGDY